MFSLHTKPTSNPVGQINLARDLGYEARQVM